ncbi:peptidylprolyl isomerase [Oricola sp.]|uniref:peptidylprolyl isomerase n=1 Tax=Oricola sp. TaxID=1979950 RepID=UPI003BAAB5F9
MNRFTRICAPLLAAAMIVSAVPLVGTTPAAASEIKVVVNDEIVTSYDIARRKAFLRLQRRPGNHTQIATDELINDALKRSAVRRAGYRIPERQVDRAFANFARSNNMSVKQITQILNQSGVTAKHFKDFIRLQIGWGELVKARSRSTGKLMNEQDVVAKMLERGGPKPTSTEYTLQQVIFVIPKDRRKRDLSRRRTEANNMRGRIDGCQRTIQLATQLRDVTVRDLGRFLELRLPEFWKKDITGLTKGQTTRVRDTANGVEFVIVCDARSVSDDRVAQLEFSTEGIAGGGGADAEFLEELREAARIQRR